MPRTCDSSRSAAPRRPCTSATSRIPSVGLLLTLTLLCGCQAKGTRFEILSFKEGPQSQVYTESFETGYFFVAADHNWSLAFEIAPNYVLPDDPPTGDAPADDDQQDTATPCVPVRMSQTLLIEVFWRAQPGRTHAESSQTNANIQYCLTAGKEIISYEGAGFVSFKRSRDGRTLTGLVESSSLYPVRTVGAPVDLFGPCRLSGTFEARENRARVVAIQQGIRMKLGPASAATNGMTSAN